MQSARPVYCLARFSRRLLMSHPAPAVKVSIQLSAAPYDLSLLSRYGARARAEGRDLIRRL
jgi:hypothetical protein